KPFTHESLLIDQKDYRLTRVEKRQAKQRYEREKALSQSYQTAALYQLHQMQLLQQQQLIAAGVNPALMNSYRYSAASGLYTVNPSSSLGLNQTAGLPSQLADPIMGIGLHGGTTAASSPAGLELMRQMDRQARLRMLHSDFEEARRRTGYAKTGSGHN
ncbi:unnamed protein product, partial [Protopolystoma xenopodis]